MCVCVWRVAVAVAAMCAFKKKPTRNGTLPTLNSHVLTIIFLFLLGRRASLRCSTRVQRRPIMTKTLRSCASSAIPQSMSSTSCSRRHQTSSTPTLVCARTCVLLSGVLGLACRSLSHTCTVPLPLFTHTHTHTAARARTSMGSTVAKLRKTAGNHACNQRDE